MEGEGKGPCFASFLLPKPPPVLSLSLPGLSVLLGVRFCSLPLWPPSDLACQGQLLCSLGPEGGGSAISDLGPCCSLQYCFGTRPEAMFYPPPVSSPASSLDSDCGRKEDCLLHWLMSQNGSNLTALLGMQTGLLFPTSPIVPGTARYCSRCCTYVNALYSEQPMRQVLLLSLEWYLSHLLEIPGSGPHSYSHSLTLPHLGLCSYAYACLQLLAWLSLQGKGPIVFLDSPKPRIVSCTQYIFEWMHS